MSKEAMTKAIKALKKCHYYMIDAGWANESINDAFTAYKALEAALAEQPAQQEPVAWTLLLVGAHNGLVGKAGDKFVGHPEHYERVDVYTSPPAQRKPLTDEELDAMFSKTLKGKKLVNWVARAIEAAHGIKENT